MNSKDKKIRILQKKTEKDKEGFAREYYLDAFHMPLWAHFRSISGREFFASQTANYEETAVFTVNWRKGIKPGMYVYFKGEVYRIIYIDRLEGYKADIKLRCETAVKTEDVRV